MLDIKQENLQKYKTKTDAQDGDERSNTYLTSFRKKGIFLSPKMEETIQATSAEVNTIVHIPPHCDI